MLDYINGTITIINSNSITIDINSIGYKVYTPNPYLFTLNENAKVFLYNHVREDENSLYGFKFIEERDFFLKLINVKGIGPKMALPMLATGSLSGIVDAIDRENILYLTKFPKIGEKIAKQIILDLKGKLVGFHETKVNNNEELVLVLESLGYKNSDIKKIISQIDNSIPIENQVKEALKLLMK